MAEYGGPDWRDAQGLTIFLPNELGATRISSYVSDIYGLDFLSDSHWIELVSAYVDLRVGAPDAVAPQLPSTSSGLYPPVGGARSIDPDTTTRRH